jgi:hypothetical protein
VPSRRTGLILPAVFFCLCSALVSTRVRAPNEAAATGPHSFCAAYLNGVPLQLSLFPFHGPEVDIPAPPGLLGIINVLSYSLNGRVIYAQRMLSPRQPPGGILKIEFDPPRVSTVPGSADEAFARVYCLSESPSSGLLTVAGNPWSQHRIFEIDQNLGARTEIPINSRQPVADRQGSYRQMAKGYCADDEEVLLS